MKLLILLGITILLKAAICISDTNSMKRKKKHRNFEAKEYLNPFEVQTPETIDLAKSQTLHARNLIYNPNPVAISELKNVAEQIKSFLTTSPMDENLGRVLSNRILNGGILTGKTYEDLLNTIDRLANDRDVTANDREIIIALLGDLGALATEDRLDQQKQIIREAFSNFCRVSDDKDPIGTEVIEEIKQYRGSSAVGPTKRNGRSILQQGYSPRSGILNKGSAVNANLRVEQGSEISPTSWPLIGINKKRLNNSKEPWSGHMSGSPTEILLAWDLLIRVNPLLSYPSGQASKSELEEPKRKARAALAGAFLVSMGYHSALEVIEGTSAYFGTNYRESGMIESSKNAGHSSNLKDGGATRLMVQLFKEFTKSDMIYEQK